MARARNIKPGFFVNDRMAENDPLGRLLFVGLWCIADRAGRLEDRPKKIKVQTLPYDDCDVNALLDVLHNKGFIIRYSVDDKKYIEIVNFSKHQNPHPKEAASVIPAFNGKQLTSNLLASDKQLAKNADSPSPLIDSPIPLTEASKDAVEGKVFLRSPFKSVKQQKLFDSFWEAYPKKKSKGQAEKIWIKLNPDEQLVASMIATIEQAKKSREWLKDKGEFIPHPSTWLNAKGWEDEYEEMVADKPGPSRKSDYCETTGRPVEFFVAPIRKCVAGDFS